MPESRTSKRNMPSSAGATLSDTSPRSVNFTAFDSRLRRYLHRTLAVGDERVGRTRRAVERQLQMLRGGHRRKRFAQRLQRASSETVSSSMLICPASTFDRSRMSLISTSKVAIGRVNRFRVAHLLFGQIAGAVLLQQFGEDQRTVQRRAQLVRHVGEELGLVAARLFEPCRVGRRVRPARATDRIFAARDAARTLRVAHWSVRARPAGFRAATANPCSARPRSSRPSFETRSSSC